MIHFLVNNDYQLLDANRHAAAVRAKGMAATLIVVPHALQCAPPEGLYDAVVRLDSPIKGRRWPAAWLRYRRAGSDVARLRPHAGDVLALYTEYELLNHLIIKRFRAAGAKVVLIEDGGVGTYLPFSDLPGQALTARERLMALSVKCLPGLADTRFKKMNGVLFPWCPDEEIDLLCVYRQFTPARRIRSITIEGEAAAFNASLVVGRVVFLNEAIYDHYQGAEAYLRDLDRILTALCEGYEDVLFKFHPRETPAWRERIAASVLKRHPRVTVIEENVPFELLLETYAPEALASYFSTPLLNLSGTGIEPLFLYHLLEDLREQPVFAQLTALLKQWHYRFAPDWAAARRGYQGHMRFWEEGAEAQHFASVVHALSAGQGDDGRARVSQYQSPVFSQ